MSLISFLLFNSVGTEGRARVKDGKPHQLLCDHGCWAWMIITIPSSIFTLGPKSSLFSKTMQIFTIRFKNFSCDESTNWMNIEKPLFEVTVINYGKFFQKVKIFLLLNLAFLSILTIWYFSQYNLQNFSIMCNNLHAFLFFTGRTDISMFLQIFSFSSGC